MTVRELLARPAETGLDFQRLVNSFVDEFRRTDVSARIVMMDQAPAESGEREGLMAAVVSALCREMGMDPPEWVRRTHSPTPFFAFPARGFALRLRLMLESPPAFRIRNVFVPENYLSRA